MPATSRHPFQGSGVWTTNRGRTRAARVRVPFSAPEGRRKDALTRILLLLLKQKAAIFSVLYRDPYYSERNQIAI